MKDFQVTWSITIDAAEAATPVDAALLARAAQLAPETTATVFDVSTAGEHPIRVDLSEIDQAQRRLPTVPPAAPVLNSRELNTIVHALRVLQEIREPLVGSNHKRGCKNAEESSEFNTNATACDHFLDASPLNNEEIGRLIDRMYDESPAA